MYSSAAVGLGGQVEARAFVGDADITRHQLHGFADRLRRGSDIEGEPDRSRVSRRREVKPQGAVSQSLSGKFEESRLRGGGHTPQRVVVLLGQARASQQRPRFQPGSLQEGERRIDRETDGHWP